MRQRVFQDAGALCAAAVLFVAAFAAPSAAVAADRVVLCEEFTATW